ncbi:MAG: hypothetical protein VW771_00155 [Gammaproteobacteria bacterium]
MARPVRSTNFLRPIYRLGWLVIWSSWLAAIVFGVPAWMPHDDVVGWGFVSIAFTLMAYLLHRCWDWWVVGRPITFRR